MLFVLLLRQFQQLFYLIPDWQLRSDNPYHLSFSQPPTPEPPVTLVLGAGGIRLDNWSQTKQRKLGIGLRDLLLDLCQLTTEVAADLLA